MEENSIQKNKRILLIATITYVSLLSLLFLINCSFNNEIQFVFINNQNTGEPIGAIGSIFLYILLWGIAGLIPSAMVFFLMLLTYSFLHRKDPRFSRRFYHPPYEEEYLYGGKIAFTSTYIAVGILIVLQMFNIVSLNV